MSFAFEFDSSDSVIRNLTLHSGVAKHFAANVDVNTAASRQAVN